MRKLFMKRGYLHTEDGVPWHRIVCEEAHGPIPKGWHVHHIDGNKLNNSSENLIAVPEGMHSNIHKCHPLPGRSEILRWLRSDDVRLDRKAVRKAKKRNDKKQLEKLAQKMKKRTNWYGPRKGMTEAEKLQAAQTIESFIKDNPDKFTKHPSFTKDNEELFIVRRKKRKPRKHQPKVIIRKKQM